MTEYPKGGQEGKQEVSDADLEKMLRSQKVLTSGVTKRIADELSASSHLRKYLRDIVRAIHITPKEESHYWQTFKGYFYETYLPGRETIDLPPKRDLFVAPPSQKRVEIISPSDRQALSELNNLIVQDEHGNDLEAEELSIRRDFSMLAQQICRDLLSQQPNEEEVRDLQKKLWEVSSKIKNIDVKNKMLSLLQKAYPQFPVDRLDVKLD